MNINSFNKKIVELCDGRNIPYSHSVSTQGNEIIEAIYSFNNGNIIIEYSENDTRVTTSKGLTQDHHTVLFYWDCVNVRIKENVYGFEIKFDIPTPVDTYKLKLFVTGGDKIPMSTRKVGDPLAILMESPDEWFDIIDLSKMTKLTRHSVSQQLRDIPHVVSRRTYIGGKRHASYYCYTPTGSQNDSEPVSNEE